MDRRDMEMREMLAKALTERDMDADEAQDAADILVDIMDGEVIDDEVDAPVSEADLVLTDDGIRTTRDDDELIGASARTVSVAKMLMDLAYIGEWYYGDIADVVADVYAVGREYIVDAIFEAWCDDEYRTYKVDNIVYEWYYEVMKSDEMVTITIAEKE